MGDSSSTLPDSGDPAAPVSNLPASLEPFELPPLPTLPLRRRPWPRFWALLGLTFLSMTVAHALGDYRVIPTAWLLLPRLPADAWTQALWYSVPCLAILTAHEFGHYLAARYYRIDTSLPHYLPMPLFFSGTLGAFIRIRQPIFRKRDLFDIGIAGPIAGFLVTVPLVFIGVEWSTLESRAELLRADLLHTEYGDPLLIKLAIWLKFGMTTDDDILLIHPIGMASWFGLIITSLNLFPFGQLDGGHISYAVLGRHSATVSKVTVAVMVALAAFVSVSWVLWAAIMLVMLYVLGPKHPAVLDENVPLDRGRLWLAALAVLMFILCFTPVPVTLTR